MKKTVIFLSLIMAAVLLLSAFTAILIARAVHPSILDVLRETSEDDRALLRDTSSYLQGALPQEHNGILCNIRYTNTPEYQTDKMRERYVDHEPLLKIYNFYGCIEHSGHMSVEDLDEYHADDVQYLSFGNKLRRVSISSKDGAQGKVQLFVGNGFDEDSMLLEDIMYGSAVQTFCGEECRILDVRMLGEECVYYITDKGTFVRYYSKYAIDKSLIAELPIEDFQRYCEIAVEKWEIAEAERKKSGELLIGGSEPNVFSVILKEAPDASEFCLFTPYRPARTRLVTRIVAVTMLVCTAACVIIFLRCRKKYLAKNPEIDGKKRWKMPQKRIWIPLLVLFLVPLVFFATFSFSVTQILRRNARENGDEQLIIPILRRNTRESDYDQLIISSGQQSTQKPIMPLEELIEEKADTEFAILDGKGITFYKNNRKNGHYAPYDWMDFSPYSLLTNFFSTLEKDFDADCSIWDDWKKVLTAGRIQFFCGELCFVKNVYISPAGGNEDDLVYYQTNKGDFVRIYPNANFKGEDRVYELRLEDFEACVAARAEDEENRVNIRNRFLYYLIDFYPETLYQRKISPMQCSFVYRALFVLWIFAWLTALYIILKIQKKKQQEAEAQEPVPELPVPAWVAFSKKEKKRKRKQRRKAFRKKVRSIALPVLLWGLLLSACALPCVLALHREVAYVSSPFDFGSVLWQEAYTLQRCRDSTVEDVVIDTHWDKPIISISDSAFHGCKYLRAVTIGKDVTRIGRNAFSGCESLRWIVVDKENAQYCTIDGNLYRIDGRVLHTYAKGSDAKSFAVPQGVIEIEMGAFSDSRALEEVYIPASVVRIRGYAFENCDNLEKVTIENGTLYIGEYAFANSERLTEIFIPASVKRIEKGAFAGCKSLERIVVDEKNPYFYSVDGVLFEREGNKLSIYPANKQGSSYTVPQTVMAIGDSTFSGNLGLTEIILPESVVRIGANAFSGCKNLTAIVLPNDLEAIGKGAFSGCTSLREIDIPVGVKIIPSGIFSGCTSLERVTVSPELTTIESYAFLGCAALREFEFPQTVIEIASEAFARSGLVSITVPDSVIKLGQRVFYNCLELQSAALGSGIKSLKNSEFEGCKALETLYLENSITEIHYSSIYRCIALFEVYYNGTAVEWGKIITEANTFLDVTIHFTGQTNQN